MSATPSRRGRLLVALVVGSVSAAYLTARAGATSDFDQVWAGALAVLAGQDPYAVIGPGRAMPSDYPLYYPLTALVAVIPLAGLSLPLARTVFVAISCAACALALTRDGWFRWPAFLSAAFVASVGNAQWAPLLVAAVAYPWLGAAFAAKPNVGAALWIGATSGRARWITAGTALLLVSISLAVQPRWPLAWRAALHGSDHLSAPILRPGGAILALALLRGRRPEARMLFALACAPSNPGGYEALPLFLIPGTLREALVLAALTHLTTPIGAAFAGTGDWSTAAPMFGMAQVATAFIPCLVMVLRRPNDGRMPLWLERTLARVGATAWRERS